MGGPIQDRDSGLRRNETKQLNKDFIEEAFQTRKGARWKVGPNFKGEAGLSYQGARVADYKTKYELKSGSKKKAWKALIALCKTLSESSPEALQKVLPKMLDVDHALWFLALVDEKRAALSSKLLAVPKWRAQYLRNCRTLLDTWVDWQEIQPLVTKWRAQIEPIIKTDDKALYGHQGFLDALANGTDRSPDLQR